MLRMRFAIFSTMALTLLLVGTGVGQMGGDAGQYVILNAQYGNEYNHVDVTERLRMLAREDKTFRVSHNSMAADPAPGHSKALRVFARGPNGQERFFDFRDGSVFDGGQFSGWRRGEWAAEHWEGGWNGRTNVGEGGGENHGGGEYRILTAQYGSERHHVDVTHQLREMARHDVRFRLNYATFGVDPDEGHAKALRIFARGPEGRERMFEYRDNSFIDGSQFRGWGSGEWGNGDDHWSGRWEGEERDRR